jgi:hypothetical protein
VVMCMWLVFTAYSGIIANPKAERTKLDLLFICRGGNGLLQTANINAQLNAQLAASYPLASRSATALLPLVYAGSLGFARPSEMNSWVLEDVWFEWAVEGKREGFEGSV